jgi:hypothetical protein
MQLPEVHGDNWLPIGCKVKEAVSSCMRNGNLYNIHIRRLNHEVIVVRHQAVGITHPPHAPINVPEYLEKAFSALSSRSISALPLPRDVI